MRKRREKELPLLSSHVDHQVFFRWKAWRKKSLSFQAVLDTISPGGVGDSRSVSKKDSPCLYGRSGILQAKGSLSRGLSRIRQVLG